MSVSVIIPTHNDGPRLSHAALSALSLPGVDEVIVIDDGSPTPAKVDVGLEDKRVKLIQQSNAGAGAARNRGMSEARGEWFVFLDADDILMSGTTHALKLATEMNTSVALSGGFVVSAAGQRSERRPGAEWHGRTIRYPSDIFRHSGFICMSGVMMHRRVFDQGLTFDESMRACQDSDFLRRAADVAPVIKTSFLVVEHSLHAHKSGSNISSGRNIETRAINWLKLYDRWYEDRVREDWQRRLRYWVSAYAKYGSDRSIFDRLLEAAAKVGHPVPGSLTARFTLRAMVRRMGLSA